MVRPPAVAGRFYPADAGELTKQIQKFTSISVVTKKRRVCACFVPHAGYMYSGAVAGAVFEGLELPKRIIVLGVRHFPRGHSMAILSEKRACPLLHEDAVAHSTEHSLEVQLPFLQVLASDFQFVPIALGTVQYDELRETGEAIAKVVAAQKEPVLILTTSDMNHYEDDATTRRKDHKAIEQLLKLDAGGLYDTVRSEGISMCGLGPSVTMLVAAKHLGVTRAELVKYATSADVNGERAEVVGYAGMIFE